MPKDAGSDDAVAIPVIWRRMLAIIAIGKAAVGGAGATLAIAGAFNVAAAVTAQHWVKDFEKHYLDLVVAGGGASGAAFATIRMAMRAFC